jgi:hypothetical protein
MDSSFCFVPLDARRNEAVELRTDAMSSFPARYNKSMISHLPKTMASSSQGFLHEVIRSLSSCRELLKECLTSNAYRMPTSTLQLSDAHN